MYEILLYKFCNISIEEMFNFYINFHTAYLRIGINNQVPFCMW